MYYMANIYSQILVLFRVYADDSEWELCSAKYYIFSKKKYFVWFSSACLLSLGCQVATICYVSIITRESRHKRIPGHQMAKLKLQKIKRKTSLFSIFLGTCLDLHFLYYFHYFMWLDHNCGSYLTCYKLGSNEYNAGKLYICYLVHYKHGSPVPC